MKLRWLAIPGLLLLALGLVLGLLPHSATIADQYGAHEVKCGMAFAGDSDAKIAENSAALVAAAYSGRYVPGQILSACSSAQALWLPVTLLIVGGVVVLVALALGMQRRNRVDPQSVGW